MVGCLASIPLFLWLEPLRLTTLHRLDRVAVLGILELAFIVYGVAMLLFYYVLKRLDVAQATLGNYMLPFFHRLAGCVRSKESITRVMWIGGVIVLVSTLLVTVSQKES